MKPPSDAVAQVQRLAQDLGRTPTQMELRRLGIATRDHKAVLLMAGCALRRPGGKGGWSPGTSVRTARSVVPLVVEDAVGQRVATGRLALYRVPPPKGDELSPLATWMEA